MEKLHEYMVNKAPPTIYYIPNFITEEEEQFLLKQVNDAPKPKWTYLSHRRLQNWGGLPHPKGMVSEKLPEWLTRFGTKIGEFGVFDGKMPNHVLVNEYLAGQGIMPHLDGSLYFPTVSTISLGSHTLLDFYHPLAEDDRTGVDEAATCKDQGDIQNTPSDVPSSSFKSRHLASILVEPRSLILVRDDMYNKYLHGIAERDSDLITEKVVNVDQTSTNLGDTLTRTTRVSLTIRHVPKVLKANLFFGKRR